MLLLDQGNSRLKWRAQTGVVHVAKLGDYEPLLAMLRPGEPARLASTAPAPHREHLLARLSERGVVPHQVVAQRQWRGLHLAYSQPERFGVDRWLALLAARERYPERALVVLSAGTALTADAVSAEGRHLGGYIAPGPAAAAAALPAVLSPYAVVGATRPGQATAACVAAGYSSLYVGALALWRQQFALPDAALLLTGGNDACLADWCEMLGWAGRRHPHLVLDGLALV